VPEVSLAADTAATPAEAWVFIENMENWAPFLTGYQRHETIDDRHSLWVVKGELAGLTLVAEFRVAITEWVAPSLVAFELEGVDEPFAGSGHFRIAAAAGTAAGTATPRPARGWWARLRDAIARRLLRGVFGQRGTAPPAVVVGAPAATRLECTLALNAGGGSGPIMNLLLAPMLPAIAQDMADRIIAALAERTAR
jgi:carbon monoxide dehydrogenase subunit G